MLPLTSALLGRYNTVGYQGAFGNTVFEAFTAVHDARLAIAKLAIWAPEEGGPVRNARECIESLDVVVLAIDSATTLRRDMSPLEYQGVDAAWKDASRDSSAFVAEARKLIGAV